MRLPSSEQVTIFLPDGEKDPAVQGPVCPENICIGVPEGTFHIQTVPSSMPPKITGPEGCQFSHYHQFILAGKSYKNFITRLKRNHQFLFPYIPNPDLPIHPARSKVSPIVRKSNIRHTISMSIQLHHHLPIRDIPNIPQIVPSARDSPILMQRNTIHRACM